tara:strand:+ start:122 stop:457 length:336 start_codon:yes stop_codon:yes gene_type:complete
MAKYATGRFAKRISDRSGMAFPYNEMVKEWNGSTVHTSEFEAKHPQLDPKYHPTDAQSLQNAKPQRVDATVPVQFVMTAANIFQSIGMQPVTENKETVALTSVGNVTVVIS